tara:strand:+ start:632 stop:1474 length:843 start_codon:yes stop_codon:yes gene_type:complete
MTFFDKFPKISYDINKDGTRKVATDILRRVAIRKIIRNNASAFESYAITDGETPEMVAHKFYNDANLHWIVLLSNEIINPYFDWCLGNRSFEEYLDRKYPYKAYYIDNVVGGPGFNEGADLYNVDDRSVRGFIDSWDPTYRKLILRDTTKIFDVGDVVEYDNKVSGTITRIVDIHKESLHHFEDINGNKLNPYGTAPPGGTGPQIMAGQTGTGFESTAATFGNTILYSYIVSEDGILATHTPVSNRQHEEQINENKRTINIIKEHLIVGIDEELKRVVNL